MLAVVLFHISIEVLFFFLDLLLYDIYIDPAIDETVRVVYRDRERSVPRYNQFRRGLLMIPISKWEDLTDDEEALQTLREVYGEDVEKLDLLVGLMAEKKIKGFAISETAFFIFIIMASRYIYIYTYTHTHTIMQ